MRNLTAITISFLRQEYTRKCVQSLIDNYSCIKILVAENGEYDKDMHKFLEAKGIQYHLMPFDSGVCFARNRLIDEVKTKYVLIGDDDFFYTETSQVDKMVKFLETHKEFSLIGGRIMEDGTIRDYQAKVLIKDGLLQQIPLKPEDLQVCEVSGLRYQEAHLTFNFFVARTEDIKDARWDQNIKVAYEHSDWFIGLQKLGIPVAFSPDPIVIHKPKLTGRIDPRYLTFRSRRSDKEYFFSKWGLTDFIDVKLRHNTVLEFRDKFFATTAIEFEGRQYNQGDIIVTKRPNEFMKPV